LNQSTTSANVNFYLKQR